jgi:hypothetical protein
MLAADIHLMDAHLPEGNIAKTEQWNILNIRANINRMEYHLGVPMGNRIHCIMLDGGKRRLYELMADYCLPTEFIDLPTESWSDNGSFPNTEQVAALDR